MEPTVLPIALSKSFPTPNTHEFARVVVKVAEGAPDPALALAVAPIGVVGSTPVKLTRVIDAAAF